MTGDPILDQLVGILLGSAGVVGYGAAMYWLGVRAERTRVMTDYARWWRSFERHQHERKPR